MQASPKRSRSELKPADKYILKQKTMSGRLNGLKGMAWAYALCHHTGLSGSTASKKFSSASSLNLDVDGNPVITNHIYRYLRGETAPKPGPRGKHGFDLVSTVDRDPLGRLATPWLTHPIWGILSPDMTLQGIRKYLSEMPEEFKKLAFKDTVTPVMFNRVDDSRKALRMLYRQKTFDAYTAVIALLRESHLTGDKELNEHAWTTHKYMAYRLSDEPVFVYIREPFMHYVGAFSGFYTATPISEAFSEEPQTALTLVWRSRYGNDPSKFWYLFSEDD